MYNIIEALHQNISKEKPLVSPDDKLYSRFYLNPSSSMSYSSIDGSPIGACIKQVWLDKKNYPITNPITTYNEYIFEAGKLWEKWLIDQYKSMGIYLDNSVKLISNFYQTSGEIDILHKNPENGLTEVTEVKTYTGSNYYAAKEILGHKDQNPKPKDGHLLQCIKYLMVLKDYDIHTVNLVYIDRSCSSFFNNKQFKIYLVGKEIYYDTYYQNALRTIHINTFNTDSLKEKDDALLQLLAMNYVPDPDFKISYTLQDVEQKYKEGLISKTAFDKVEKGYVNPEDMSDWQCRYCKFGKNKDTGFSTCIETQNV